MHYYHVWDVVAVYVELVDDHRMVHVGELYVGEGDGFRVTFPTLQCQETVNQPAASASL